MSVNTRSNILVFLGSMRVCIATFASKRISSTRLGTCPAGRGDIAVPVSLVTTIGVGPCGVFVACPSLSGLGKPGSESSMLKSLVVWTLANTLRDM